MNYYNIAMRVKKVSAPAIATFVYSATMAVIIVIAYLIKGVDLGSVASFVIRIYGDIATPFIVSAVFFGISKEFVPQGLWARRWLIGFLTLASGMVVLVINYPFVLDDGKIIGTLLVILVFGTVGLRFDDITV